MGTLLVRLCIGLMYLNKAITKEMFTIPTLKDLSSKLTNMQFYSVIDVKYGFFILKLMSK